jgi:ribonuclease Z
VAWEAATARSVARFYARRMDLSLAFLGTGGSVPTARRATACLLLRCGGDRIMIDCGEGAQRQMHRSTGLLALDEIYVTHLHADHYLGLPGLIKTYDLMAREAPLRIIGPQGLADLFKTLRRIFGRVGYELELMELGEGEAVPHDGYEIRSFPVDHNVLAYGYAMVETERPGRFDPARARELGVTDVAKFGVLQRGGEVEGSNGTVRPEQVMGEARPGRKVVVSGDTRPCEMTRVAAHEAELLVHDGSFAVDEVERAAETGHSTARAAAELAKEAEVELLAIVHASSRYRVTDLLAEAEAVGQKCFAPRDFDLVEIPFPERGEPKVVENGARERRPSRAEGSEPEISYQRGRG